MRKVFVLSFQHLATFEICLRSKTYYNITPFFQQQQQQQPHNKWWNIRAKWKATTYIITVTMYNHQCLMCITEIYKCVCREFIHIFFPSLFFDRCLVVVKSSQKERKEKKKTIINWIDFEMDFFREACVSHLWIFLRALWSIFYVSTNQSFALLMMTVTFVNSVFFNLCSSSPIFDVLACQKQKKKKLKFNVVLNTTTFKHHSIPFILQFNCFL